jgi:hypothetical protein
VELSFLVQEGLPPDDPRIADVRSIADELRVGLGSTTAALAEIPAIGGTSHAVDAVIHPIAESLGFSSQKKDLFAGYPTRLRPDWHLASTAGGILLEVERGKTLTNNMDLLDLWKCHTCREADHLFLIVPLKVHRSYGVENVYSRVVDRMSTFMRRENAVNVSSISVYGY